MSHVTPLSSIKRINSFTSSRARILNCAVDWLTALAEVWMNRSAGFTESFSAHTIASLCHVKISAPNESLLTVRRRSSMSLLRAIDLG